MSDRISRQAAIDYCDRMIDKLHKQYEHQGILDDTDVEFLNSLVSAKNVISSLPSAEPEIIRCKDCKHNPKDSWFGCPMSHLNERQRPEDAWCWRAERRTDATD